MKNIIVLPFVLLASPVVAQFSAIRKMAECDPADSVQVIASVTLSVKATYVKPPTIYKLNQKSQTVVAEEKPEKWRALPKGSMGVLVNTKRDPYADIQPHLFFEIAGLSTHLSTKCGGGFTSRGDGFSMGAFTGQYMRRVDDYGDVTYRAKQFRAGWHYGYYVMLDQKKWNFNFSQSVEKKEEYFEARLGWKIGKTFPKSFIPPGLEMQAEAETYLGAGGGFSYRFHGGRYALSLSYLVPGLAEEQRERAVNLIVAKGLLVRLNILWL